jgi:hypothetical protein
MDQETAARFERTEHFTAAMDEQRRKDREEYKAVWRDTQHQINELAEQGRRTERRLEQFIEESRAADDKLAARIEEVNQSLAARIEQSNQSLAARIESLTSAIGELVRRLPAPPQ